MLRKRTAPAGRMARAGHLAACKLSCAAAATLLVAACAQVPPRAPPDVATTAQAYTARRLDTVLPDAPPPSAGWDRAQWLQAALQLNPQLQEQRARETAVSAGERTAAQIPNPTLNLYGEYISAAAGGVGWLYGLSMDFLLQRPGERSRARRSAALETQAAAADVAGALWQLRAALRQDLLDAVYCADQAALLQRLAETRQALLTSARRHAEAGETARTEVLAAQIEAGAVQQRLDHAEAEALDARARLAATVGVPAAALQGLPLRWPQWDDIGALPDSVDATWRGEALIARPDLMRALREYDLAQTALENEAGKRWPLLHVTPGYAWDKGGVKENQLNENLHDNELGLSLELPLFNRNEGPIGEAVARRELAGRHLEAVQAALFEQIDRAELAWPQARRAWQDASGAAALAQRRSDVEQRAVSAGAGDRPTLLAAQAEALEAQLLQLQAAWQAQQAFAALEDAYRRPLQGPECALPLTWRLENRA